MTWCLTCATSNPRRETPATTTVDGDPMCGACAVAAGGVFVERPTPTKPTLCTRGCGRPTHRGRCQQWLPKLPPQVDTAKLQCASKGLAVQRIEPPPLNLGHGLRIIERTNLPDEPQKPSRLGAIIAAMEKLKDGEALEIPCSGHKQLRETVRRFKLRFNGKFGQRRALDGKTLWLWKEEEQR